MEEDKPPPEATESPPPPEQPVVEEKPVEPEQETKDKDKEQPVNTQEDGKVGEAEIVAEEPIKKVAVDFDLTKPEDRKSVVEEPAEVLQERVSFVGDKLSDDVKEATIEVKAVDEETMNVDEVDYYIPPEVVEVEEVEEEVEEVEEESTGTESEESDVLDRDEYILMYKILSKRFVPIKTRNLFLQRKMAEYFKRRKMEHVLRETDQVAESLLKYHKKLDLLYNLKECDSGKRGKISNDLTQMRTQRTEQLDSVTREFAAMQHREKDIGTGLINTKTGKEIPEKFLERLLWHQQNKTQEITAMRLCFVKIRDAALEKQQAIRAMDKIGEHHTLIDYEQLKMENQGHADKIEERDEELTRLRFTCANAIECLAHIREKCVANTYNIQEAKIFLSSVQEQLLQWRGRVNKLKSQRDSMRADSRRMKEESGLLTKPKLLRDMQDSIEEVKINQQILDNMKAKHEYGKHRLDAIKKNVTIARKHVAKTKHDFKQPEGTKLYKGRPSLMIPTLENDSKNCVNVVNI